MKPSLSKNGFIAVFWADLTELTRARWYQIYVGLFATTMACFFAFGLTESSVMGFTGLSRLLLTFIQANIIVLPIFILVTTVRTFVGDREMGVWEYLLSWPINLHAYYWGKVLGRIVGISMPLVASLFAAALYELARGGHVPWIALCWIVLFIFSLTVCFTGMSALISVIAKTQEFALGAALAVWIICEAAIDAILLGILIQQRLPAEVVVSLALANPLQIFRTASIAVFDPELSALGPISISLLDFPGQLGLCIIALAWPITLGLLCAWIGDRLFAKCDLTS